MRAAAPTIPEGVHVRERIRRRYVKGDLQLVTNRDGKIRSAHVHERVSTKSFVNSRG